MSGYAITYGLNTTERPRDQSGRFIGDVDRDEPIFSTIYQNNHSVREWLEQLPVAVEANMEAALGQ